MHRFAFFFVCLFSTLATLLPVEAPRAADAAPAVTPAATPTQVVERLHNTLIAAMKGGAKMSFEDRRKLIDPVVRETFDMTTMSRVATGSGWQKLSEDDRNRVITAFTAFSVANYASQFKSFDGESFVTKTETDGGRGRRAVDTTLVIPGDEPVDMNYQLRQNGSAWQIVDVYLDGSVSQLAMRRNEFAAAMNAGGVDNLVAQMNKKTSEMAKSN